MVASNNIVLLHGWGASINKLKPLAGELEKLKWETLTLKLPGFDKSPPKTAWGVGEYAEYVLKESRNTFKNQSFFVFGHSFGGRIAIKIASTGIKNVSGVILCSTSGLSRRNFTKRVVFWLLAKVGRVFVVLPKLALLWRKLIYKLAREHDYEKTSGIMREVFKKVIAENLKPSLIKIKVPVLILWGKKDKTTPIADAYLAKKRIDNSNLVIFNNQGHQLPYKEAKKLAEEVTKWSKSQS